MNFNTGDMALFRQKSVCHALYEDPWELMEHTRLKDGSVVLVIGSRADEEVDDDVFYLVVVEGMVGWLYWMTLEPVSSGIRRL